jgi:hypothetical protein
MSQPVCGEIFDNAARFNLAANWKRPWQLTKNTPNNYLKQLTVHDGQPTATMSEIGRGRRPADGNPRSILSKEFMR